MGQGVGWLLVGLIACAGLLALTGCSRPETDAVQPPPDERDATAPAAPVPAPTATPTAPGPGPEAPTPSRLDSRVEGAGGTVADPEGDPPPTPQPAADLRAVELTAGAEALQIDFVLDGPVPDAADFLLWSLELHADDELAYTVSVQQVDGERVAAVFDWDATAQDALEEFTVAADTVTVTVPWSLVPRATDGFEWAAVTQLDGAWEDRLPAAGTVEARP